MDPKTQPTRYLAPTGGASGSASSLQLPGSRLPGLDDRLVKPETREEMVRDELVIAQPASPPHAERHTQLDYVIRGHVAEGYVTATDMLTRSGEGSDFATDTSVRKQGINPQTKARYLEELAFEVVCEQSMRDITVRAEDLTARGVRRLLAIFVKRGEVAEWSVSERRWITLSLDSKLADPTLVRPVEIRALLDAAAADNAVVDALDANGNPRLRELQSSARAEGREQGREQGLQQGRIDAVELACRLLGISLRPEDRAFLRTLDPAGLDRLLAKIEVQRRWP